jgi:hypothetical protein
MIRAAVRRDGPGEWSFTVADDQGEVLVGTAESWRLALYGALQEVGLQPKGPTIPLGTIGPGESRLIVLRGPITPGDATVPAGGVRCDRRPAWRRWLGL